MINPRTRDFVKIGGKTYGGRSNAISFSSTNGGSRAYKRLVALWIRWYQGTEFRFIRSDKLGRVSDELHSLGCSCCPT